jgi:hypothetical protein
MNADVVDFPKPLALEYLQHIEALTAEIKAGMDAIGSNALSSFERSVSKQQDICTSLSQLTCQMSRLSLERETGQGIRQAGALLPRPASAPDRALTNRIRIAAELLLDLNRQYAALLKHSGESVRLFAGLCRSYTGHFQSPAEIGANRPGWSCQS